MAIDARDKDIAINDFVRYGDTGTVGKVIDIKTEDEMDWVLIDKTGLWYNGKLVEILDEKDINVNDSLKGRDLNIDDLKDDAFEFNELEMDMCNGGG